jgi:hypothetical protein
MSTAASAHAQEHFGLETMLDKMEAIFYAVSDTSSADVALARNRSGG